MTESGNPYVPLDESGQRKWMSSLMVESGLRKKVAVFILFALVAVSIVVGSVIYVKHQAPVNPLNPTTIAPTTVSPTSTTPATPTSTTTTTTPPSTTTSTTARTSSATTSTTAKPDNSTTYEPVQHQNSSSLKPVKFND